MLKPVASKCHFEIRLPPGQHWTGKRRVTARLRLSPLIPKTQQDRICVADERLVDSPVRNAFLPPVCSLYFAQHG